MFDDDDDAVCRYGSFLFPYIFSSSFDTFDIFSFILGEGEFDDPIMGGLYRYSEVIRRRFPNDQNVVEFLFRVFALTLISDFFAMHI